MINDYNTVDSIRKNIKNEHIIDINKNIIQINNLFIFFLFQYYLIRKIYFRDTY